MLGLRPRAPYWYRVPYGTSATLSLFQTWHRTLHSIANKRIGKYALAFSDLRKRSRLSSCKPFAPRIRAAGQQRRPFADVLLTERSYGSHAASRSVLCYRSGFHASAKASISAGTKRLSRCDALRQCEDPSAGMPARHLSHNAIRMKMLRTRHTRTGTEQCAT